LCAEKKEVCKHAGRKEIDTSMGEITEKKDEVAILNMQNVYNV